METQISRIVEKIVGLKASALDEKFRYWHDEVNKSIDIRLKELNRSLFLQIVQLQNELSLQH
jgi:hypothetical protein